jgi:hypothetical protein
MQWTHVFAGSFLSKCCVHLVHQLAIFLLLHYIHITYHISQCKEEVIDSDIYSLRRVQSISQFDFNNTVRCYWAQCGALLTQIATLKPIGSNIYKQFINEFLFIFIIA